MPDAISPLIDRLGAGGAASDATPGAKSQNTVDYESFLKLLVTEMQNQDPTEPMDSSEFVAQLATFSNVEQGVQINTKLDALLTSSALAQADGVIGRTVTSADGSISGQVVSVRLEQSGLVMSLVDGSELAFTPGVAVS